MAVTAQFENSWIEMQEKYGSGIDSGEVDVIAGILLVACP